MRNLTKRKKKEILPFNTLEEVIKPGKPLNSQCSYITGAGQCDLGGVVLLAERLDLGRSAFSKVCPFSSIAWL